MFLPPMLPEKRETPFDDARYIFEPKIDGLRMIVSIENGKVRLYNRYRHDITEQFPELHPVPIADHSDAMLDGVAACIDPVTGKVEAEWIRERYLLRKPMSIRQGTVKQPVIFFAFDILRYRGEDLRARTLLERKEILANVLDENRHYCRMITVEDMGSSLFETVRDMGLGGIVAKKKTSEYVGRRDPSWLQIVNYRYAICQIAGYRKHSFGWLLHHRDKPVGIVDRHVPPAYRNAFLGVAKRIATGEDGAYVYVEPCIQAKVRFRNWTDAGTMRAPEFVEFVV